VLKIILDIHSTSSVWITFLKVVESASDEKQECGDDD